MKLKRSKFTSIFFLVSFFISVSTNICLASLISSPKATSALTKDHLRLSEDIGAININDILFEENENEDENELDVDLSLIPFFLKTFTLSQHLFYEASAFVIPTEQPIYIQISNIRI